jgi:hypothetical protein
VLKSTALQPLLGRVLLGTRYKVLKSHTKSQDFTDLTHRGIPCRRRNALSHNFGGVFVGFEFSGQSELSNGGSWPHAFEPLRLASAASSRPGKK